jgi:transcriptional regulatory protein LevR
MSGFDTADFDAQLRDVSTEFGERLDMLEGSGQITALARWLTEHSLAELARTLSVRFEEKNAAPFVTHLGIALTRLQRGDEVEPSAVVADEIAERVREREVMRKVMGQCEELLDREVPKAELDYITVHLCALLEDE